MAEGDTQAHVRTYAGFLRLLSVGTVTVLAIAALVIWLIAA